MNRYEVLVTNEALNDMEMIYSYISDVLYGACDFEEKLKGLKKE